jgi:hypothetical protein
MSEDTDKKEEKLQPRMAVLKGDPCVVRDTYTGKNFHMSCADEAAELVFIVNDYVSTIASMITYAESLPHLENTSSLEGEEETHG